ncbi:MAG: glycosyltransferase [Prolixibacteraceae bacterium]
MSFPDTLVVTATLGTRPSLSRTIESVKKIGGNRVKHVIVAPAHACQRIREKYPHLTVLQEPANCKGIYPALNFGLKAYAKNYQYLTYINDDDFWYPSFQTLFQVIDHHNVDIVYGRVNFVDVNGNVTGEQASSPRYQDFGNLLHKEVVLFTQQATLTRSDLFLQIGGFDENFKLVSDTKFWLEALHSGAKFRYVDKICAAYTMQIGQLSSNKALQKEEHEQLVLMNEIANPFRVMLNVLFFRLWNLRIYYKRYKNKLPHGPINYLMQKR